MENKKVTLWVIIVLLILFIPITIFSTIMHFKGGNLKDNPNHEFKYNNKLYFYDNDNLIGIYNCVNSDGYCDYARERKSTNQIMDERKSSDKIKMINNRFVFLFDSKTEELAKTKYILYDLKLNKEIAKFNTVKNYGIGIENDYFIVENDKNLWGVITLEDGINYKIDFLYDYIGLVKKVVDGKIDASIFAVLKDNEWQLIDKNKAIFKNGIKGELFTFNNNYIVTKQNDSMQISSYDGRVFLNGYKYINFFNKYLEIIDMNNNFYLFDLNGNRKISSSYPVESIEDVSLKVKDNNIELSIKNDLKETIAFN